MKILLLGRNGQIGRVLAAALPDATALGRADVDLRDMAAVAQAIAQHAPDLLINAAAYTDVDGAEAEPALAMRVNAEAVGAMAEAMARRGGWLVHYSTDYVFDGSGTRPWRETDATGPLNAYGRSKRAGEERIIASGCLHAILRTGWVYAAQGRNFPRSILRAAREKDRLRIVNDQFGAPTSAAWVAEATARIVPQLAPAVAGIYHLTAAGETSWYGLAFEVLREATAQGAVLRCPPEMLQPIASTDYGALAPRPLNSRLDTGKVEKTFGLAMPPWTQGLGPCMAEWMAGTGA